MRHDIQILAAFVGLSVLHCSSVRADDQSSDGYSPGDTVPLSQNDLREIAAQVLAKEPLLSSSPGIKYAEALRSVRAEDIATVIYYPHSENAGIKQAFQVACSRQAPPEAWICEDARIRRYLALDTQDYEVRVTGPIGSNAAMALIEATRKTLPVNTHDGIAVPYTAMIILSYDDGATVIWADFEGDSRLMMKAHLVEGGDPSQPDDWMVGTRDNE